jgi:dnd system-associated protein 4
LKTAAPPSRRFEMRLSDDWPDRVYVDKEQYDRMHELTSKASEAEREVPFKSLKEVLMAAALLGYKMGEKADITEKKEIIFTRYLDSQLDLPLVCCLAIADEKTVEVINDKKKVLTIFESYIKGGFDYLYDRIMDGPDKIQNYAYYLLKEHITD